MDRRSPSSWSQRAELGNRHWWSTGASRSGVRRRSACIPRRARIPHRSGRDCTPRSLGIACRRCCRIPSLCSRSIPSRRRIAVRRRTVRSGSRRLASKRCTSFRIGPSSRPCRSRRSQSRCMHRRRIEEDTRRNRRDTSSTSQCRCTSRPRSAWWGRPAAAGTSRRSGGLPSPGLRKTSKPAIGTGRGR